MAFVEQDVSQYYLIPDDCNPQSSEITGLSRNQLLLWQKIYPEIFQTPPVLQPQIEELSTETLKKTNIPLPPDFSLETIQDFEKRSFSYTNKHITPDGIAASSKEGHFFYPFV